MSKIVLELIVKLWMKSKVWKVNSKQHKTVVQKKANKMLKIKINGPH